MCIVFFYRKLLVTSAIRSKSELLFSLKCVMRICILQFGRCKRTIFMFAKVGVLKCLLFYRFSHEVEGKHEIGAEHENMGRYVAHEG